MKNCIEYPGHLRHGILALPGPQHKLDTCLLGGQDTSSGQCPAESPLVSGVGRRRTRSEGVAEYVHPLLRQGKSLDLSCAIRRSDGNSYLLLFGEENGKASVIVYGLRNKRIFQKPLATVKKIENLEAVCCSCVDDAPFLFFFHISKKNAIDLVAYDVLEGKFKSRANPKLKCELRPMINTGVCIACFRRNSDTVEQFNTSKNRWDTPIKLHHPVDLPVVVNYDETRLYIFYGKIVQRYDITTESVKSMQISEFISTGFGFVFNDKIYILSDCSVVQFDPHTESARRLEFSYLQYRRIHTAFVRYDLVFVLITNDAGKYEILNSNDLVHWQKVVSFPKRLNLICTELVDYAKPCPVAPFETFDESLKMPKYKLS